MPSAGILGLFLRELIGVKLLAKGVADLFDSNLGFQDDEPHPRIAGRSISFMARGDGDIEQDVTEGPPS